MDSASGVIHSGTSFYKLTGTKRVIYHLIACAVGNANVDSVVMGAGPGGTFIESDSFGTVWGRVECRPEIATGIAGNGIGPFAVVEEFVIGWHGIQPMPSSHRRG